MQSARGIPIEIQQWGTLHTHFSSIKLTKHYRIHAKKLLEDAREPKKQVMP